MTSKVQYTCSTCEASDGLSHSRKISNLRIIFINVTRDIFRESDILICGLETGMLNSCNQNTESGNGFRVEAAPHPISCLLLNMNAVWMLYILRLNSKHCGLG